MSFHDLETSTEFGRPVVLYQFTMGSAVWRYTSADEPITTVFGNYVWTPVAITHDDITQTGEPLNEVLTITAPSSIGPAQLFMSAVPPRGVFLTIYEKHDSDPVIYATYVGEISQIGFPVPGMAKIRCETLSASMGREGLRLAWQRSCPYAVYDQATCKLNKNSHGYGFQVISVSGNQVIVQHNHGAALPAGKLNDGFIEAMDYSLGTQGVVQYHAIETHESLSNNQARLTINGDPSDLTLGPASAFPGCALTPAACQAFGNYDNYGGHVDMPGKSPFDGLDSPFF